MVAATEASDVVRVEISIASRLLGGGERVVERADRVWRHLERHGVVSERLHVGVTQRRLSAQ